MTEIISEINGGTLLIRISGDIDHHSAKGVRVNVDKIITENNPKELILDLSGVEFMDSSGLGLVLGRYKKQSDSGGRMKILNPTKRIYRILELAGVEKIISIEKSR